MYPRRPRDLFLLDPPFSGSGVFPAFHRPFNQCIGWAFEAFSNPGAFASLSGFLSSIQNSHVLFQLRTKNAKDASFVFAVARELPEMIEHGVDTTVARLQTAFETGHSDGRFPISVVIAARGSDLRKLVGDAGASFVLPGETCPLPLFLDTAATDLPGDGLFLRRMMLRDRAAADVMRHLLKGTTRTLQSQWFVNEISPKRIDFSPQDGGADMLHSIVSDHRPTRFLLSQVKGSWSQNPLFRGEMKKEVQKHYPLDLREEHVTRPRKRRLLVYPELREAISATLIRDDLAERLGLALSRPIASGRGNPDWIKGFRRTAPGGTSAAYMPWFRVEVALLDPEG